MQERVLRHHIYLNDNPVVKGHLNSWNYELDF